jgi:hypothetical protein
MNESEYAWAIAYADSDFFIAKNKAALFLSSRAAKALMNDDYLYHSGTVFVCVPLRIKDRS